MRKTLFTILGAMAALTMIAGAALAAVTYEEATGGFAGKGDVAAATGIHEKNLLSSGIAFTYVDTATYEVPCKKDLEKKTMTNTFNRKRNVDATVAHEARKNKQLVLTGFILAKVTTSGDNVACPGGWEADGDPVLISSSDGGLFVSSNGGDPVALPNTP